MAQGGKDPSGGHPLARLVSPDAAEASGRVIRRVEVRPEDVLQPDRRPWRRLSLDGVVARLIGLSALAVLSLLGAFAGLGRLYGLW